MSETLKSGAVASEALDMVAAQLTAAIIMKGTGDEQADRDRTNETAIVNLFFTVKANLMAARTTRKAG